MPSHKRVWGIALAIGLAVTAAGWSATASAQASSRARATSTKSPAALVGNVAAYDGATGTLAIVAGSKQSSFILSSTAVVVENGKSVAASTLAKGEKVKVSWSSQNGHNVASRVQILATPASAKQRR